MILWHGLVLLILLFVRTSGSPGALDFNGNSDSELTRFSYWPSPHNGVALMRLRKRDLQNNPGGSSAVVSEGGAIDSGISAPKPMQTETAVIKQKVNETVTSLQAGPDPGKETVSDKPPPTAITTKLNVTTSSTTKEVIPTAAVVNETKQHKIVTSGKIMPNQMDINNPGVIKRGLIVFGGFSLLGVAYYVFFKRKGNKNETNNTNNNDQNQFRYGVLQSEDRRDNLELSRIPLTMESDEDDDDDLEIFDLGQKKKSLSYVNLQTHEDDVDLSLPGFSENSQVTDRQDLLLDIEDRAGDTLINWTTSNNKSVL